MACLRARTIRILLPLLAAPLSAGCGQRDAHPKPVILYVERIHDLTGQPHVENVVREARRRVAMPGHGPVSIALWPNTTREPLKMFDADSMFRDPDRYADFQWQIDERMAAPWDDVFDAGLLACNRMADQSGAEIVIMAHGFARLDPTPGRVLLVRAVSRKHRLSLISTGDPKEALDMLEGWKPLFSGTVTERPADDGE